LRAITQPLILVFGATGHQGGSVVDYLLKSGKYSLRAITRHTDSESSKSLASRGVEMIQGDFTSKIPSSAYENVYGLFLVTNYWDSSQMGNEYDLAIPIIEEAKSHGVEHFIFSTLPNAYDESDGNCKVSHFSDKARIEQYIRSKRFKYTSFPAPGFFYQNFQMFFPPKKDNNGNFCITMPARTTEIPALDITQFGKIVLECLNNPQEYDGKFIPVAGEKLTAEEYVKAISKKVGKNVILKDLSPEEYVKLQTDLDKSAAEDMAEMFRWFKEYGYYGKRNDQWDMGKRIDPSLRTFSAWLDHTNFHLPITTSQ